LERIFPKNSLHGVTNGITAPSFRIFVRMSFRGSDININRWSHNNRLVVVWDLDYALGPPAIYVRLAQRVLCASWFVIVRINLGRFSASGSQSFGGFEIMRMTLVKPKLRTSSSPTITVGLGSTPCAVLGFTSFSPSTPPVSSLILNTQSRDN
jgi:hypothetical protein